MNAAASAKDRLFNLANSRGEDFNRLLEQFVLERFLHRLSHSPHRDLFILKGAMLFSVWLPGQPLHRATRDLDLLGFGSPQPEELESKFRDILSVIPEQEDGVLLALDSLRSEPIKEGANYKGRRLLFTAQLGTARIKVQVDVGFGDSVHPAATTVTLPTLLGQEPPVLRIYPRETVIAEKLHAILNLGLGNSRMKDFFDLQFLSQHFPFKGQPLTRAVELTFQSRGLDLQTQPTTPTGLSDAFSSSSIKQNQWKAFQKRSGQPPTDLNVTVQAVGRFLLPVLTAVRDSNQNKLAQWPAGGPWSLTS